MLFMLRNSFVVLVWKQQKETEIKEECKFTAPCQSLCFMFYVLCVHYCTHTKMKTLIKDENVNANGTQINTIPIHI